MKIFEIEIDEKTLAEVNEAIEILQQNREEVFQEALRDLAKKRKRKAEVRQMYAAAYRKNPVQPDEFFVEEKQLIEVWKDL